MISKLEMKTTVEATYVKDPYDSDEEHKAALEKDIDEMFIEADIDLNGMIDFDEYCKVMKENKGISKA